MNLRRISFGAGKSKAACKLWISGDGQHWEAVNDPEGLGGYRLALDRLIREQSPALVHVYSDDPEDFSMLRKALSYLSEFGGEVGVATQLPEEEVAAIFGVDIASYREALQDPDAPLILIGEVCHAAR
ncbi:hypothetical protein MQE22_08780 [Acidithiobacillus sp. YTS05]|nr:hypothetical protein MQE22_08780 [Acidithiobacillus sp. YTS05]